MRTVSRNLARSIRAATAQWRRPFLAGMTLAVVATSALMPATTPAAAQSGPSITLYEHINFNNGYSNGQSKTLSANAIWYPNLQQLGFDNLASSLTVPQGVKVALFEHANYLGACKTFTANDPDLRDNFVLNDRVSSVLFGQDCPLQLYDSAGYNGPYRLFWSDVPNLGTHSFDNTVGSLRVPPGKKVAAYSDINYGGICEEFTADDPDLYGNASGTARISSVKFGASCPPQVVFFEHLNYEGAFIKFDTSYMETLSLQSVGWSDRVSSVYLAGGDHSVLLWYEEYVCNRESLQYQFCHWETVSSWFSVSTPDTRSSDVGEDRADYARIGRFVVW